MSNPYANGRKTSRQPYERLRDPTVSNASNRAPLPPVPPHGTPVNATTPLATPFSAPGETEDLLQPAEGGRRYSYLDDTESVGAQSVPSYRGQYNDSRNPYAPQAQSASYPSEHQRSYAPAQYEPRYEDLGAFPSYPVQEAPSYHSNYTNYPSTNYASNPVPWDANAVNSEVPLVDNPQRGRRSTFAGSFRKFFDPESQSMSGTTSGMGRANSVRHLFGLQREPTINEYDDEEDIDYQIPINGDEYQLNTWQPVENRRRSRGYTTSTFPEGDISQGYEGYGGGYTDQPLAPWTEDEQEDEKEDMDAESGSDQGDRAVQTIQLFRGNLVLDCPVSNQLLEQYPEHRPVREFTHMRYTATTCDPADFVDEQYTLRQMCYTQPRQTELMICVTVYNEDDILLARTLQGVFNNIRHLCHRDRSSVWGVDGWKKVVVCVVADGRTKLNPRAKALMAALGVYQEGFAKNMVNDKAVEAHLYEYTSMVRIKSVDEKEGVKLTTEKATPVQLLFCMKEKNKKKINSHRWFFQAFSEVLKPNVCVLLDSGTRPGNHAIYHLWKSFHRDSRVAGACGEIAAMLGPGGRKLINPLVATQNFEYKMSNILDKPSESVFGFITVLPGAFSAYRFEALRNHPNGEGPLEKYFKGEKLEGKGSVFQANMYLAEDRILCWELVSKRGCDWILRYVKSAKAHTDVPEHLSELILQRRRWLNGSFFAQIYSLAHWYNIWRSGHSLARKLAFHFQFLYQLVALVFSWFSLGNFFLVFHILASSVGDSSAHFAPGKILSIVLSWIYLACIITAFVLSFGNRPQGTKRFYDLMVIFFALLMAYVVFVTIYISVKGIQYAICANGGQFEPKLLVLNSTFRDLIISLLCTYALYFISSLMFLDPWHVFTSMLQYVLLSPSYVNIMNVYAFCNTHDISWGTKGDVTQELDLGIARADEEGKLELELPTSTELIDKYYLDEVEVLSSAPPKDEPAPLSQADKRPDYYALVRSVNVLLWIIMNLALVAVVLNVGGFQTLMGNDSKDSDSSSSSSASDTGSDTGADAAGAAVKRLISRASTGSCEELASSGSVESQVYMAVIFWSVAAMAAYRFILGGVYLLQWIFRAI